MKFEQLLGKSVLDVEKVISIGFRDVSNNRWEYHLYTTDEYFNFDFLGLESNQFTLTTDEKKNTQSITIHFREVINRQFYDSFIEKYGEPDHIQVIENIAYENSESHLRDENGNIVQTARKGTLDLREGTFEEDPLFIIWKKEAFEIRALLRHEQSISEIIFSLHDK